MLPRNTNDILSANLLSKRDIPVITENLNNIKEKCMVNMITVRNENKKSNSKGRVKKQGAGIHNKGIYPRKTDHAAEDSHDIVVTKGNERLQENNSFGATDLVTKVKLLRRSLKNNKSSQIHQCHICEKTFPSRGKLNAHVAAHLSLPEFQCDKCSKTFRSKFSLR